MLLVHIGIANEDVKWTSFVQFDIHLDDNFILFTAYL